MKYARKLRAKMAKNMHQSELAKKPSRPYITIEYNHTEQTEKIFMRVYTGTYFRMEKDGRIINPNFMKFNKKFRNMFSKLGYDFVPKKKSYLKGKKRVFGINVTVRKIDQYDKKMIRIKIEGTTVDDVTEKSHFLEREVRKIIHEDPETRLWKRLEMC